MAQPYVGEIRVFGGNFAPNGWAFCEGQLLPISENETLFVLIGTTYGGDGQSTFGVPDLRGRVPVHMGSSPSGGTYQLGEMSGQETRTLTVNTIPAHTHQFVYQPQASSNTGTTNSPVGAFYAATGRKLYYRTPDANMVQMANIGADLAVQTGPAGGVANPEPFELMQPYLAVNFIISLFGIFPSPT